VSDNNGKAPWPERAADELELLVAGASGRLDRAIAEAVEARLGALADRVAALEGPSPAAGTARRSPPPATGSGFRLTALDALLAEPAEAVAWLVENRLPTAGSSLLGAKPKAGKSTFGRCLARAVAAGLPFLGQRTQQGTVVYLALEEKRAEVAAHFRRMGAEGLPIYIHTGAAPEEATAAFMAAVDEHRPVLAIIDPLQKLVRARDLNDYAEVSRLLEPLTEYGREHACHVHFCHHMGKLDRPDGDGLLGSTALFGAVDTALIYRRREDVRTLKSLQRYGADMAETVIALDPETGLIAPAGDVAGLRGAALEAEVLAVIGEEAVTGPDIRERVGGNDAERSRAIRRLLERDQLRRLGAGKRNDPFLYFAPGAGDWDEERAPF
jgi:hypothetical protein